MKIESHPSKDGVGLYINVGHPDEYWVSLTPDEAQAVSDRLSVCVAIKRMEDGTCWRNVSESKTPVRPDRG